RIVDFPRHLDLRVRAPRRALSALQRIIEAATQVVADPVMRQRPPGHRARANAVELVAALLLGLPSEELGDRHGSAQSDVHARDLSANTAATPLTSGPASRPPSRARTRRSPWRRPSGSPWHSGA